MTRVLSHRGRTPGHRENTLEAFGEAGRLGADGVELDVRRAADGTLVVHHDPVIEGLGPIAELDRSRLPPHVPTLGAALEACSGLLVNAEIKNNPAEVGFDPIDRVARDTGAELAQSAHRGGFLVSSFRAECLEAVRIAAPELATGLLVSPFQDAGAALERCVERGYSALHPFVTQASFDLLARARRRRTALYVWTVNANEDLIALCRAGVDGVITDQLEAALAARRAARP